MNMNKKEFLAMGTLIEVIIYAENPKIICDTIEEEIKSLETKMNFYNSKSEVSLLNKHAYKSFINVSKDTFNVIKEAKRISNLTNKAFDITLAPLINLWGIFSEHEKIPKKCEIEKALSLVNSENIILDETNCSVKFTKENMMIDLGGIAKGYASDKSIEICKNLNAYGAIINLGGNVSIYNSNKLNDTFNVGIQNPLKNRNNIIGVIRASNESLVTSGNYERYFEAKGKKYGHIISSSTGYPIESDLLSVTIKASNSMEADGIATAIFALGYEKGQEIINNNNNIDALFIMKNEKIVITEGLQDKFYYITND